MIWLRLGVNLMSLKDEPFDKTVFELARFDILTLHVSVSRLFTWLYNIHFHTFWMNESTFVFVWPNLVAYAPRGNLKIEMLWIDSSILEAN